MTATTNELTQQETRWRHWQSRYVRSSRRNGIQARIVAAILFAAIVGMLLMQLLTASRVA